AKYEIPLIFDEVVTGFRFAWGGAQEYFGVVPDLCTLGKVIGGGFPLAAVAGREDLMAQFDRAKVGDERFLFQVGTLSGNPVAAVAGLATLEILKRPGAYETVFATGRTLMEGIGRIVRDARLPAQVIGAPVMFDLAFTDREVHDYRGVLAADADAAKRFTRAVRNHGVLKSDNKMYVSLAHDAADVRQTLAAFAAAAEAEARAR
ncbi:MAG TPA: aminotransferase class III-fold pyridoxal phosphate-dependent enzyme, partial [Acetobacteraceae bacterium]|nr:aminotransferase class III-fold pyridoxal phosphate-dependent enzyme [Acetobacteraceae bacterium]